MARRIPREPRAHWLLLSLAVLLVLIGLCAHGYIAHVGADGRGPVRHRGPAALPVDSGPLLRVSADGQVTSRAAPTKTVALTFDDGPDPRWTPKILDVLTAHKAHATFFVIGSQVNDHPEIARKILAQGSELGAHSFSHRDLAAMAGWQRRLELTLAQNAIAGATGKVATLSRPPYSSEPDAVTPADLAGLRDVGAMGQFTVLATQDPQDWRPTTAVESIVKGSIPADGRGAVLLLHDGGGDRQRTVAALGKLLNDLHERGYRVGSVSEVFGLTGTDAAASGGVKARGVTLRYAQTATGWLSTTMTVLLFIALVLTVLRLVIQVWSARRHIRRVRRRRPRRFLGPVTVIVPAHNEAANIAATVTSLIDSSYPELEVIVVDDGSTDGTAEVVWRLGLPGVRIVQRPNGGKARALNTGLSYARNDIIVMVDGDTIFEPEAIAELVQPFIDPMVGAISGNTKVANRRGLLGRWQHLEYVIGFNLDRRMFDIGECMPTVPGAIGAFRREALADTGGLSSDTLAEDTDLTMAVLRAGWRVVYAERAVAWTEVPATLRQLWRQRYRWCYGTMQSMWKHRAAVREGGYAGKLGRRGLAYLLLFQVALPLAAPAVDAYAIYGAIFLPLGKMLLVWCGFMALQLLTAAYALHLDRERYGPLWALPLQQIVYRQLMYLVVVQSTVTALLGNRLRWHRVPRTGSAEALLRQ
jgi:cellulose synthase/poly-beta-1,6-N-acetylglucosamine synthase-like glycosyltransferase/peptidoglycan/xylan/chitin deacetylase (PgdA/CDA1 family)